MRVVTLSAAIIVWAATLGGGCSQNNPGLNLARSGELPNRQSYVTLFSLAYTTLDSNLIQLISAESFCRDGKLQTRHDTIISRMQRSGDTLRLIAQPPARGDTTTLVALANPSGLQGLWQPLNDQNKPPRSPLPGSEFSALFEQALYSFTPQRLEIWSTRHAVARLRNMVYTAYVAMGSEIPHLQFDTEVPGILRITGTESAETVTIILTDELELVYSSDNQSHPTHVSTLLHHPRRCPEPEQTPDWFIDFLMDNASASPFQEGSPQQNAPSFSAPLHRM
jgi:hypothetical protein